MIASTEVKNNQTYSFTVKNLFQILRDGLILLVPIAERADIVWSGPDVYDNWDDIASGLFSGIVKNIVYNLVDPSIGKIPDYSSTFISYNDKSFFTCSELKQNNAFVSFYTKNSAFDCVRLLLLDDNLESLNEYVETPFCETKLMFSVLQSSICSRSLKDLLSYVK